MSTEPARTTTDAPHSLVAEISTASEPVESRGSMVPSRHEAVQELLESVVILARFATESGQLPPSVEVERLYRIRAHVEEGRPLDENEFATLVAAYQLLERRLGPVTVATLRATDNSPGPSGERVVCDAERYVRHLQWRTYINIAFVLVFHIVHKLVSSTNDAWLESVHVVTTFIIPFLYGSLGADAALLRETTHALHTRQFDPRRIPENGARFLLGTLCGGLAAILVDSTTAELAPAIYQLGGATVGFIAGYSNDFLFSTIDRILEAVLPGKRGHAEGHSTRTVAGAGAGAGAGDLLPLYRRYMDQTDDPQQKAAFKLVVEDLEERIRSR